MQFLILVSVALLISRTAEGMMLNLICQAFKFILELIRSSYV